MTSLRDIFKKALDTIDEKYYVDIIENLVEYSSGTGFRLAGTSGEREAVKYIKSLYEDLEMDNITIQRVPIDKWIFKDGYIEDVKGELRYPVVSYAGCRGGTAEGKVVYVGRGFTSSYEGRDVRDAIVLIDMDYNRIPTQVIPAKEAFNRGAKAVLFTHLGRSGLSYVYDDTFFTCNGDCEDELGLIGYIPAKYAKKLIEDQRVYRLVIDVELKKGYGYNVIGSYDGEYDYELIVGAHHDAYFKGVLDNASGVAFMIGIAKLIKELKPSLKYRIRFISFTAEEYGHTNTLYDYLIGSHYYFSKLDINEVDRIILFLNSDVTGYLNGPISILATPDYFNLIYDVITEVGGSIPEGVYIVKKASIWLDMWPAIVRGVGSISFTDAVGIDYYDKYYHTQKDDLNILSKEKFKRSVALGYTILYYINDLEIPMYCGKCLIDDVIGKMDMKLIHQLEIEYDKIIDMVRIYGSRLDDAIRSVNIYGHYISNARKRGAIRLLNQIRRILYREIFRLGIEYPTVRDPSYRHEYLQSILNKLKLIKFAINKGDIGKIENYISELGFIKWARFFSRETYEWIYLRILEDDYWAKNVLPDYIDLYPLYEYRGDPEVLNKLIDEVYKDASEKYRRCIISLLNTFRELTTYMKGLYEWILGLNLEEK